MKSDAMHDFENANGGHSSSVSESRMFTSESMARAHTRDTPGGIARANPSSTLCKAKIHPTFTASAPNSSTMTSKIMGSYPTFQDLIKKGRKAQADDERTVYETKKAKEEAGRAKATRARLATDNAVRNLALDSRSDIDTCKGKLIDDMEKNLRAVLESEIRAEIREKVYEDEKKISATYEREIKDSTRLQLENDLEPVIVAELSAKLEEEVKETLRAELESEVKEELRARYKAEVEEDLRDALEDAVRKELQDLYRDEVRSELKVELSPSIRAELIASLGIQHVVPDLDDLDNQQSSYPDLGNMQHLNYNGGYQEHEGESRYDEEEGDDIFDDAPEQSGSGPVGNDNMPNPITNADHFKSGLMNTNNLPSPIADPNQLAFDILDNDDLPQPITNAEQAGSGFTSTGSQHLKRHIDEDYDESDDEGYSGVDRPAEKKIKISSHYDLMANEDPPSANNINGNHIDEQAPGDDGDEVQYGKEHEDGNCTQVNGNINTYHGGEQLQKDGEEEEDGASPLLNGNFDAYCGTEPLQNDGGMEDFGHFSPVNSNFNAYPGEEQPQDAECSKADGYSPALNGNTYSNGNGNEHHAEGRPQDYEAHYEETQYETFRGGEGGNARYPNSDSISNAFDREEERDFESKGPEEEDEDDADDDEEDEEDDEEDSEDYGDTSLANEGFQQPFGNHYGGTPINEAPRVYSRGMKHFRSEEEEEYEGDEAHDSKRHHRESYPTSEEEYSEVDSNEDDYESESQDAQGERTTYSLIKESNTQETAFVIDSSDDEDHSNAVDEEQTLVDDGAFLSSKIETYVEESHFVEN